MIKISHDHKQTDKIIEIFALSWEKWNWCGDRDTNIFCLSFWSPPTPVLICSLLSQNIEYSLKDGQNPSQQKTFYYTEVISHSSKS